MIGEDGKLFAIRIKSDLLNLPNGLTAFDFKFSRDSQLFVLSTRDVKNFNERLRGYDSHKLATGVNFYYIPFLLRYGKNLLDLTRVAAYL